MYSNFLNLRRRVIARIYMEFVKNTLMEYPDYFMFALFAVASFMLVSIQNVLANIPKSDFIATFNFFVYAVENTDWILQVLIAGLFIRFVVSGARLIYKNMNTGWITAKLRY